MCFHHPCHQILVSIWFLTTRRTLTDNSWHSLPYTAHSWSCPPRQGHHAKAFHFGCSTSPPRTPSLIQRPSLLSEALLIWVLILVWWQTFLFCRGTVANAGFFRHKLCLECFGVVSRLMVSLFCSLDGTSEDLRLFHDLKRRYHLQTFSNIWQKLRLQCSY